jgi:hypothetical protein
MIRNQAQAQTQRNKSSPGTIPHNIQNRPNSRGKTIIRAPPLYKMLLEVRSVVPKQSKVKSLFHNNTTFLVHSCASLTEVL